MSHMTRPDIEQPYGSNKPYPHERGPRELGYESLWWGKLATPKEVPMADPRPQLVSKCHLLDLEVWNHAQLGAHAVFVRGKYPARVWRCARHDCDWSFTEDDATKDCEGDGE